MVPAVTGSSSSVVVPASVGVPASVVVGFGFDLDVVVPGVTEPLCELPEPPPAPFMAAVIDARMSVYRSASVGICWSALL